jgi:outer membrane lipoprotein-sorting protein
MLGWILTLSVALPAAAADSGWGLESLMQMLAQVKSARAAFTERKEVSILNAPLESSGTLVYRAPGFLEKRTVKPKPETLVLDNETLTLEDKARNRKRVLRLQEHPAIWALVESIRATLAGDRSALARFYRITLEGSEAEWRLTLDPTDAVVQRTVERVRISGSHAAIREIEVFEAAGDHSLMAITELKSP